MNARLTGVLIAMAALLSAGLSTGTQMYYWLFFVLLTALLLALISALWTLLSVRVTMKGAKSQAVRGDTLTAVFTVRHASPLPAAWIGIRMSSMSAGAAEQEINVQIPPFALRTFRQSLPCPHRGVYEAGVTRIFVRDVFGLFTLSRTPKMKSLPIEVLPKASAAEVMALTATDMGPEFRASASEDNASPSDIRQWQDGDSLKKVHWKLSMRRRELLVRTYEEAARPDTLVIPDLSQISALRDQQLTVEDRICECCLSAAKAQLEAGYPVRMPLTSAQPSEVSGQFAADAAAFANALMRVRFDSPYAYEQVIALMLTRMQRTGGAVLATAHLTTRTADLAMRMHRSGIRTRLIWVTDDPREESLEMLERLKMSGVQVECVDPWKEPGRAASAFSDDLDF